MRLGGIYWIGVIIREFIKKIIFIYFKICFSVMLINSYKLIDDRIFIQKVGVHICLLSIRVSGRKQDPCADRHLITEVFYFSRGLSQLGRLDDPWWKKKKIFLICSKFYLLWVFLERLFIRGALKTFLYLIEDKNCLSSFLEFFRNLFSFLKYLKSKHKSILKLFCQIT